jgi:hypothetical protein
MVEWILCNDNKQYFQGQHPKGTFRKVDTGKGNIPQGNIRFDDTRKGKSMVRAAFAGATYTHRAQRGKQRRETCKVGTEKRGASGDENMLGNMKNRKASNARRR